MDGKIYVVLHSRTGGTIRAGWIDPECFGDPTVEMLQSRVVIYYRGGGHGRLSTEGPRDGDRVGPTEIRCVMGAVDVALECSDRARDAFLAWNGDGSE